MSQFSQTLVFQGIGTASVVVPNAGTYVVESKSTIPTSVAGSSASSLVSTIKLNASTILASVAGAQGARSVVTGVAAGDTLSVVYTSAAAVDNALNAIKSVISIYQGE